MRRNSHNIVNAQNNSAQRRAETSKITTCRNLQKLPKRADTRKKQAETQNKNAQKTKHSSTFRKPANTSETHNEKLAENTQREKR